MVERKAAGHYVVLYRLDLAPGLKARHPGLAARPLVVVPQVQGPCRYRHVSLEQRWVVYQDMEVQDQKHQLLAKKIVVAPHGMVEELCKLSVIHLW